MLLDPKSQHFGLNLHVRGVEKSFYGDLLSVSPLEMSLAHFVIGLCLLLRFEIFLYVSVTT